MKQTLFFVLILALLAGCSGNAPATETAAPDAFFEQAPYLGNCKERPSGSVCIQFDDDYIWLVNDSIVSWSQYTLESGPDAGQDVRVAHGGICEYHHILQTQKIKAVCK